MPRATACATSRCATRRCSTCARDSRSSRRSKRRCAASRAPSASTASSGRVIICAHPQHAAQRLAASSPSWRWRIGIAASSASTSPAARRATRRARTREAFEYARAHDLACTCHAGEGDGAESVREAVHVCGAHRIGHATRLIEDTSLTDYCNDRRIALEICLTSNVQTRAARRTRRIPFREYFDRGLNVVLNTDNRLMSGVTLTDEYVHAARVARLHLRRARARSRSTASRAASFRTRSACGSSRDARGRDRGASRERCA